MRRPLAGGVLIAALIAAAVAGAEPSTGASGGDAYRIGPEDTLQIAVWRNEAISKTVPVRPDGMISSLVAGSPNRTNVSIKSWLYDEFTSRYSIPAIVAVPI